jgi:tetratricopeptide (TPR) repeat protein
VRLGNVAGQARTLMALGALYDEVIDRPEEAAAFHRQAADKSVEIGDIANEGHARNNLVITLRKLRRLDEARQEIRRAIECKARFGHVAKPWKTWSTLAAIETDAGNPAAAAEAKAKAIACYLAYRRDGGENHSDSGRIAFAVTQILSAGNSAEAATLLQKLAADPDFPGKARSSSPSKPLSPAAATARSPPPRNWTSRWPPKFSC